MRPWSRREVVRWRVGLWGGSGWAGRAYAVCYGAGHGGYHGDAAAAAVADHFFGDGLRGHHGARDVDFEHGVGVFGRVLQRGRFLLDACGGDEAVELALRLGNVADDVVELRHVSDVDLSVVEGGSCACCQRGSRCGLYSFALPSSSAARFCTR